MWKRLGFACRFGFVMLLTLASCGPRVEATTVNGAVAGIAIDSPEAVFIDDSVPLWRRRQTVIIANGPNVCARIAGFVSPSSVGERSVVVSDGGVELVREPALIVQSTGAAFFDTGRGRERLRGSANAKATLDIAEQSASVLRARYTATFAEGAVNGEVVATQCRAINSGCSSGPVGAFGLLAVLLRWVPARRRRRAQVTRREGARGLR